MCRDTGYYEPRDDVAVKVVEEMVEKKNLSLMVYYLKWLIKKTNIPI